MNSINVLYVEENQDGTTGGSHACLLDLVRNINKETINPHVMFYEENRLLEDFFKEKVRVSIYNRPKPINLVKFGRFQIKGKISYLFKIPQAIINIALTDVLPLFYFIYFIIKNNIHIIHLNNTVFAGLLWTIAAKLTRRKVMVHERTRLAAISKFSKLHHKYIDYILGTSKSSELYLKENGVDTSHYSTFYDRVDVEKFRSRIGKSKIETLSEFGIRETQKCIGIVGNLQRWKGQLTVIQAVSSLKENYPDIACLLIGDSSRRTADDRVYYNEIQEEITQNGLEKNVVLTGHRDDIPDLLNAIDIFIHASTSAEPYGLVVLEAMAIGKPVIASNEGGPVEMIVNNHSGILIEPGNASKLSETIEGLLADQRKCVEMGEEAYQRVTDKFASLDVKFIERLYFTLLNKEQSVNSSG